MPSAESVNRASAERKNLPHIVSDLNLLQPHQILNGLFNFEHKRQAHNMPVSHRYHQIQPVATVASLPFSNSANGFFDFNIPMGIDLIDDLTLQFTLANSDGAVDWVASTSVPFWFQKYELRHGASKILQTKRDLHMYLDNTIYLNDFERQKNQPNIGIDKTTYQAVQ